MVLNDGSIKLLDFGLARMVDRAKMTATGAMLGKAYYMASEQRKDSSKVDARADLYALGVMFFEMLTCQFPLGYKTIRDIRPELPKACDDLMQSCLVSVKKRIKTARAFSKLLKACFVPTQDARARPDSQAVPDWSIAPNEQIEREQPPRFAEPSTRVKVLG